MDKSSFESRVWANMDEIFKKLDHLSEQVREVREEQIRMGAVDHGANQVKLEAKIEKLEARILLMEAEHSKRSGMVLILEWLYKLGPWIVATSLAVIGWWRGWLGPVPH